MREGHWDVMWFMRAEDIMACETQESGEHQDTQQRSWREDDTALQVSGACREREPERLNLVIGRLDFTQDVKDFRLGDTTELMMGYPGGCQFGIDGIGTEPHMKILFPEQLTIVLMQDGQEGRRGRNIA
jgi:hypothetical protein